MIFKEGKLWGEQLDEWTDRHDIVPEKLCVEKWWFLAGILW
jgi:hypothetical protein